MSYPPPLPDAYHDQAVAEANAWVARFAPLVMQDEVLTEEEVRRQLETVHQLRSVGPALRDRITSVGGPDEQELATTISSAVDHLDGLERDLRTRLATLAPGDPAGIVNLEALQDRLAEREARTEVGLYGQPEKLELKVSGANWAAAGFLGLFSFGWNSFTAVHATLMIGGMFKSFGWPALFLLGFYAIFFAAGFGMVLAALNSASTESIEIEDGELTVSRKFGRWVRRKNFRLGPNSKATIGMSTSGFRASNQNRAPKPAIVLADIDGSEVSFGDNAAPTQQQMIVDKINAYLISRKN